eukprot:GEMP01033121.1.p1 GENE.GEMP01033121.1~~GEMP01033121.1.p1  ORF type:complete len:528 (+),score=83.46 GEMP01033121.1:113-1585(+)
MPRKERIQGKDVFLGDREYAVVGYNGREEKYICIDAEDHQDASTDYTPHFLTEKQITSAMPSGEKPPAVQFATIARPLPGCDERGQLITDHDIVSTSHSPTISTMPIHQPTGSSPSAAGPCAIGNTVKASDFVAEYDGWAKATKLLFELHLERGFTFTYRQTTNKAGVETNRYGWLVKEWGRNGEEAVPAVYEYIIAGFDPREGRYLCYEAGNNRGLAVRIHHDDIIAAASSPEAATVGFGGQYPPLPEYDPRTLMVKGYERPTQSEGGHHHLWKPSELKEQNPLRKKMPHESISEEGATSISNVHGISPCTLRSRAFSTEVGVKKHALGSAVAQGNTLQATAPYPAWHPTSKSLYALELPRGLLFTFQQTKTRAEVARSRSGDWLIKRWGGNEEDAKSGVYEYVIASYDPREERYLCFEARDSRDVVVRFSTEEIKRCLANPLPARKSFGGRYPTISDKNVDPRTFSGKATPEGGIFGFRRAIKKFLGL